MSFLKNLFGSRTYTVTAQPSGRQFTASAGHSVLESALAQGIAFPHSCTVGTCGSCKCKLISGKIREIANFAYVLEAEELRSGIILACQAEAKTDLTLEVPGLSDKRLQPAQDFAGTFKVTRTLTYDIKEITVTLDRPLKFDAGQYVHVTTADVYGARAYSCASAPQLNGNQELKLLIRHVPGGMFTDLLFDDKLDGVTVKIHGPSGNFWLRDSRAPMLCIAGGSGLAPLMSILDDAATRNVGRPCVLLFGARAQADLYLRDEIAALARRWNGAFNFVPVLSHEPSESTWSGERGLVTEHIASHTANYAGPDAEAYLCGPPPMIDAAIPVLTSLGLQQQNLHFDKFLDGSHGLHRHD